MFGKSRKRINVKIKRFGNAKLPKYSRENDACVDCFANLEEDIYIRPGKRAQIPLGFALEIPKDYEIQVRPRSGNTKNGIDIGLGTGDADYRGEYQATIINFTSSIYTVRNGDKVCQISIKPVWRFNFTEVKELSDTERGINGFGSSGNA